MSVVKLRAARASFKAMNELSEEIPHLIPGSERERLIAGNVDGLAVPGPAGGLLPETKHEDFRSLAAVFRHRPNVSRRCW